MKQILTRVSDELHGSLKRRAAREGRSMNDLVVSAIEEIIRESDDPRERLRARASDLGLLTTPTRPAARPVDRDRVIAANRGRGPALSEALEWARGPKP